MVKPKLPSRNGFRNRLLSRLPRSDAKKLQTRLTKVDVKKRFVIYEPNKPFENIYFPEEGVASLVTVLNDGTITEVATVGYEGMVGLPVFLGAKQSPARAFWQVDGSAFRISVAEFQREVRKSEVLSESIHLYTQAFFTQLAQSVTCNRMHNVEQRCARWLLMTHDRVPGDSFDLTQEFLAQMLGIRRTGVTEVARRLKRAGLIEYSRGHMTICNRGKLEKLSCECYAVVQDEFNRLLG